MTVYALDLPIQASCGQQHVEQALQGTSRKPANYSFTAPDGTEIVYHVCGSGSRLLVAVAPGWGPGINYLPTGFHPIVDSKKVTIVCVQTRGSFPSGNPTDETRMSSRHMAADLEALREHLKQDQISVMGHSNGAAISLAYAEDFAAHCSKAILIETQCIGYEGFVPHIMKSLEELKKDPRFAECVATFFSTSRDFKNDEQATDYIKAILPMYFVKPEAAFPAFIETMGNPPPPIRHWAYVKQNTADAKPEAALVNALDKVTAEVLIITGAHDFIIGVEGSQFVCDGMKAAKSKKHVVYKESGHMPWIEEKEAFFKDVLEFLI